ncbi:MAG: HDOD domain-containing protein, partial [Planctomycetes bacterium]|nr:HDOD domain-containing protein [Planctomycetota bacterium]
LMTVINDPRSSVDDILEVIKYDQAVTGEVLRLCNSAYFGLSRKVTSLNEATVRLGSAKVLHLVMSVHANSLLAQRQAGYGLEPGMLWRHSVGVAVASAQLAQKLRLANVNLAFTAGLLHDIGKVILNEYVAEGFAEIVRRVSSEGVSFSEAEREVLGCSHVEVGGMIAETWDLPEPIVQAIRYHLEPGQLEPSVPLVDTVHLANCVCLLIGVGLGEDGLHYRADKHAMQRCRLRETDLQELGVQTMIDLRQVEQSFTEVQTPTTTMPSSV